MFQAIIPVVRPVAVEVGKVVGLTALSYVTYFGLLIGTVGGIQQIEKTVKRRQAKRLAKENAEFNARIDRLVAAGKLSRPTPSTTPA